VACRKEKEVVKILDILVLDFGFNRRFAPVLNRFCREWIRCKAGRKEVFNRKPDQGAGYRLLGWLSNGLFVNSGSKLLKSSPISL
jgi:hypothetical protein